MISFKEGNSIKVYNVQVQDPEKAQEIIKDVLKTEKRERREDGHKSIFTNYGRGFDRFSVDLIDEGIETVSYQPYHPASYSDWTLGDIATNTITYIAPYTLALGAENFSFGPYEFSTLLKKSGRSNKLASVVNKANIDELSQLLACFDNNPDALELFLKTNYPDLLYLRRYLECIRLDQTEEFSLESPGERAASFRVIERATSNEEVSRKLNLNFKGRSR